MDRWVMVRKPYKIFKLIHIYLGISVKLDLILPSRNELLQTLHCRPQATWLPRKSHQLVCQTKQTKNQG